MYKKIYRQDEYHAYITPAGELEIEDLAENHSSFLNVEEFYKALHKHIQQTNPTLIRQLGKEPQ